MAVAIPKFFLKKITLFFEDCSIVNKESIPPVEAPTL